jgi:hypothetical protein
MACGMGAFCWTMFHGAGGAREDASRSADTSRPQQVVANTRNAAGPLAVRSVAELEAAVQGDENNYWAWMHLAQRRSWARLDARDAWMAVLKTARFKDESARDFGRSRFAMGIAAGALGMLDEQRQAFSDSLAWYRGEQGHWTESGEMYARLGRMCLVLGDEKAGREYLEKAAERTLEGAAHVAADAYNLACYTCLLGDASGALRLLKHAANIGFSDTHRAEREDLLQAIRSSDDFPLILDRIKANAAEEAARGPY